MRLPAGGGTEAPGAPKACGAPVPGAMVPGTPGRFGAAHEAEKSGEESRCPSKMHVKTPQLNVIRLNPIRRRHRPRRAAPGRFSAGCRPVLCWFPRPIGNLGRHDSARRHGSKIGGRRPL